MTAAWIGGRPASLDEAVAAAAALLHSARLPLVYGLVESTVEAQREAVRIADLIGGVVDSAASSSHAGAARAFESLGVLTASLGEVRRADLVVFWGCDPDIAHPGFVERHAAARPGRVRLAVDAGAARGPAALDERLALPPAREIESLLALRAFVRGRRVEPALADPLGLPLEGLRGLARRLRECSYGVIFADADPAADRRDPERAFTLAALVRDARAKARLRLIGVRLPGNPVGAENVLAWQTGFASAVSFTRGFPRYGPGEFAGETLLSRGDADAALVVGADPARHLSARAAGQLGRIPSVRLAAARAVEAAVFIASAPLGATTGCVFRMDGVALRQRAREDAAGLPSEAAVLARIAAAVEVLAVGERR